jgi:hypothetical protein
MPNAKAQGTVFKTLVSFFMAYGMEVYNIAIRMGYNLTVELGFSSITYPVFLKALKEAMGMSGMSVIIFIVSNLVGNRAGPPLWQGTVPPVRINPYFCHIMRQAGAILVMCSMMSLIVPIFSQIILDKNGHKKLPNGLLNRSPFLNTSMVNTCIKKWAV